MKISFNLLGHSIAARFNHSLERLAMESDFDHSELNFDLFMSLDDDKVGKSVQDDIARDRERILVDQLL